MNENTYKYMNCDDAAAYTDSRALEVGVSRRPQSYYNDKERWHCRVSRDIDGSTVTASATAPTMSDAIIRAVNKFREIVDGKMVRIIGAPVVNVLADNSAKEDNDHGTVVVDF